jgi:hypothetical protein
MDLCSDSVSLGTDTKVAQKIPTSTFTEIQAFNLKMETATYSDTLTDTTLHDATSSDTRRLQIWTLTHDDSYRPSK